MPVAYQWNGPAVFENASNFDAGEVESDDVGPAAAGASGKQILRLAYQWNDCAVGVNGSRVDDRLSTGSGNRFTKVSQGAVNAGRTIRHFNGRPFLALLRQNLYTGIFADEMPLIVIASVKFIPSR